MSSQNLYVLFAHHLTRIANQVTAHALTFVLMLYIFAGFPTVLCFRGAHIIGRMQSPRSYALLKAHVQESIDWRPVAKQTSTAPPPDETHGSDLHCNRASVTFCCLSFRNICVHSVQRPIKSLGMCSQSCSTHRERVLFRLAMLPVTESVVNTEMSHNARVVQTSHCMRSK